METEMTTQEINEIAVNLPVEFEIDGRLIKIKARTIFDMVSIDKKIAEFEKEIAVPIEYDENSNESPTEYISRLHKQQRKIWNAMAKVIHSMVNENGKEEELSIEWIEEHVDMTDGGTGEQIIDAYNKKCAPENLVKKILLSKKFA